MAKLALGTVVKYSDAAGKVRIAIVLSQKALDQRIPLCVPQAYERNYILVCGGMASVNLPSGASKEFDAVAMGFDEPVDVVWQPAEGCFRLMAINNSLAFRETPQVFSEMDIDYLFKGKSGDKPVCDYLSALTLFFLRHQPRIKGKLPVNNFVPGLPTLLRASIPRAQRRLKM